MQNKKSLNLFLVDDNPMCTEIYRQHLSNSGIEHISTFDNGNECLKAIKYKPDIIFMDQHLMDDEGIEVMKKIKRIDPNIYVVIVSGDNDSKTTNIALHYGAFDYIVKGEKELPRMDYVIDKILIFKELLSC